MMVRLGLMCALCGIAGCQTTTRNFQSPVEVPSSWALSHDGEPLPEQWWTALGDSSLDELIDRALDENFTLRMAWDRLSQANAIARRESADTSPTVDLTGGVGRTRTQNSTGTSYATDWDLGLRASYEFDLWGRIRSTQDAAVLDAMTAEEDVYTSAISLSADIASRWYEYVEQSQRIKVIKRQNLNNQDVLEIITAQFRAGQNRAEDVLRQQNLVESNLGDLAVAQRQAETIRLQLLILLGLSPDETLPIGLPVLIDLPPIP